MYEIVSLYLQFGKYSEAGIGFIQEKGIENDAVIHVALPVYHELLHFIVNHLSG